MRCKMLPTKHRYFSQKLYASMFNALMGWRFIWFFFFPWKYYSLWLFILANYFLECTKCTKSMAFWSHNPNNPRFNNICFQDYQNYKNIVYTVIKMIFHKSIAIIHKLSNLQIQRKNIHNISMVE